MPILLLVGVSREEQLLQFYIRSFLNSSTRSLPEMLRATTSRMHILEKSSTTGPILNLRPESSTSKTKSIDHTSLGNKAFGLGILITFVIFFRFLFLIWRSSLR